MRPVLKRLTRPTFDRDIRMGAAICLAISFLMDILEAFIAVDLKWSYCESIFYIR